MAARRRRFTERRAAPRSAGYTLVEIMIAMLLTSIMVTSVFSVVLTVKTGGQKEENKIKAAVGTRYVSALLKNYVTAETGGSGTSIIAGPCASNPVNNWSITCNGVVDTCPVASSGAPNNCYALAPGSHSLTGILPAAFEATPYSARVVYFVTTADTIGGRPIPHVSVTAQWTEP